VWVLVRAAHDISAVFKYLHMIDIGERSELFILFDPYADHLPKIFGLHKGEREIVPWGKTDDLA